MAQKVRLLGAMVGNDFSYSAGDVVEFSDSEARALVETGQGVLVDPPHENSPMPDPVSAESGAVMDGDAPGSAAVAPPADEQVEPAEPVDPAPAAKWVPPVVPHQ